MKQKLLLVLTLIAFSANSQTTPIFNSGMSIVSEGSTSSPSNEEVWQIIDGDAFTKFLDFDYSDGMEFTVDLGGTPAIATSIEITTANDADGRDPMNYEIFGSNDGSAFTSVATGIFLVISTDILPDHSVLRIQLRTAITESDLPTNVHLKTVFRLLKFSCFKRLWGLRIQFQKIKMWCFILTQVREVSSLNRIYPVRLTALKL